MSAMNDALRAALTPQPVEGRDGGPQRDRRGRFTNPDALPTGGLDQGARGQAPPRKKNSMNEFFKQQLLGE
jgi:hypothetical protein